MMRKMLGCIRKVSPKKVKVEAVEENKAVYRDELSKKQPPRRKAAVKKTVRFAESEPTILGEDENNIVNKNCEEEMKGDTIRVKVKMTKEEAARLLAKCNGGVIGFEDVARELVSIPVNRVCVVSTCNQYS